MSGPCRTRVGIYKPDGTTLISYVPRRRAVRWLDEMNAPGTASFEILLTDPLLDEHPDLLDQFNVVKIFLGTSAIKAWTIEDVQPTRVASGGEGDNWVQVSGRGILSCLEAAIVYPEYGLRELVSEDRYFNFASKDGNWRNPTDWHAPVGTARSADTTARKPYPTNWTDTSAQWLWSTSSNAASPVGVNWFRSEFTTSSTQYVMIQATADDYFTVFVDGLAVLTSGTTLGSYRKRYDWLMTLPAGDHTIGAVVTNGGSAPNPAAFILTIFRATTTGSPTTTNVFRMTSANTIVKAYGATPGWTGANVLQQLVEEAQDRNVEALESVTFDFTYNQDSNGQPWVDRQDRIVKVGTTDLYDLAQQIIELALDLDLDPDFVLHAWRRRGEDLSSSVRLVPTPHLTSAVGTVRAGKLRNQAVLKYDGGWMELFSAVSKEMYGRREVGLSLGTSLSTDQTALAGASLVQEVAQPEQTIPVSYTCVAGPQPYQDFNLGDVLTIPDVFTGMTTGRLMSIAGSEDESVITWDLDFYPETNDDVINSIVVATGGAYGDASSLYEHEVLSDSPWAFWRLKQTSGALVDSSGHSRSLTSPSGAAGTYNQGGPIDKAYLFANSAAQYANTAATYASGIITLECWIYVTTRPAAGGKSTVIGLAQGLNSAVHDKDLFMIPDGRLQFYTFFGSANTISTSSAIPLNAWTHIAASVGPRGKRIYVNGVVAATGAPTSSSATAQKVWLHHGGLDYSTSTRFYIAEPAVYFQQLLDSRIKSHFDAGTGA